MKTMLPTASGIDIDATMLYNYIKNLVNLFFKILPLRENNEPSLVTYMESFQSELMGCNELIFAIKDDHMFCSLISVLQYLIDNPTADVKIFKREVFKAINLCKKLSEKYGKIAKGE